MAGKKGNIRPYRKPLNVNIGLLIFGLIFVYVLINIFSFFGKKHIVPYEVKMGSLSANNVYQGIALREEQIINSEYAGYINYYAREGERVGWNNLVYTVDESGRLKEMLNAQDVGQNTLEDDDLTELRTEILSFVNSFDERNFQPVYDFKYSVQGTVLKLDNINVLENLNELTQSGSKELINICRAPAAGIIIYSTDGYEGVQPEDVTEELFHTENYEKTQLISNELVSAGDPVYKLSTSEAWSVIIPVEEKRAEELLEEEYVKVRFLKNQFESWARIEVLHNADGNTYVQLNFNNSMISFCTDRFVDVELITNEEQGLKVPNSAITQKEFFLIPQYFLTKGGDGNDVVLRKAYTENGEATTEEVSVTIYGEKKAEEEKELDEYYVDNYSLRIGEDLVMPNSQQEYTVSKSGTLIGVYNVNKGYADFKQVEVLYSNDEYSIVKSGTNYGLSAYDRIVLDAQSVEEDEFIYD